MEQRIIDTANSYRQKANRLQQFEADGSLDENLPAHVQTALIKLYFAKELETQLEKCEEFLSEETEEGVFSAVSDAAEAIDSLTELAFDVIDEYAKEETAFMQMVEKLSAGKGDNSLLELLLKLYKCEGIIRMVYRCARKFPIYGIALGLDQKKGTQTKTATTPVDYAMQEMGIDIYELFEIRNNLILSISEVRGKLNL